MNAELLLKHFDRISDAPAAVPRLRHLVFKLAVRGKLVEKRQNDKPASELLECIELEKARLIKQGKLRRQDPLPLVNESTIPFSVPNHWVWLQLRGIGALSGGMTPSKNRSDFWNGDINWFSPKDIKSDELVESGLKITSAGVTETGLQVYRPGCLFMVARSGILKRTFPVAINRINATANQDLKVLSPFIVGLERYLQIMFRGMMEFILSDLVKTGTTVQSLKYEEFEHQPIPLPPAAEQSRIVAKVDELMSLCDRLDAARSERDKRLDRLTAASHYHLNNGAGTETLRKHVSFYINHLPAVTARSEQIPALRRTILSLAVRGQLVPQTPTDEPASVLIQRIQAEKTRLVKERMLRKEKPLAGVSDDEVPFAVPTTWIWTRIGTCSMLTDYGTSVKSDQVADGVPILAMGNIQDGQVVLTDRKKVPHGIDDLPQLFLKRFDLLYNRTNSAELVGKTGIYLGDDDGYTFASYLIRIRFRSTLTSPLYVNLAMNAPYFRATQIVPELQQQCGQANVNGSKLRNMLIPLPPHAEQCRIVAKVGELMALCDHLEAQLAKAQAETSHLLESVLHYALAGPEPFVDTTCPVRQGEAHA